MDRFNWGVLLVVGLLYGLVGYKLYSDHALDTVTETYRQVCAKSDGVPVITETAKVCIDKASTITIIPVSGQ